MFYFAGDNALAPAMVSQLKALKQAGYNPGANVIAYFDPNAEKTPTHIFDVNRILKLQNPGHCQAGYVGRSIDDPYVQDLVLDKLWGAQTDTDDEPMTDLVRGLARLKTAAVYDPQPGKAGRRGVSSSEQNPKNSLDSFLKFCREHYPARHYILFILGHGLIVGNDIFLLDEHAKEHSLSLRDLGSVLSDFKKSIGPGRFELISFHSCSMSALEVAYELKGTANYMLASENFAFVGSWPYREMLIKIFNDIDRGKNKSVQEMLVDLYYYCLYNSYDFQLAGYPFDLCLCSLKNVGSIKDPLDILSSALIKGLANSRAKELILLAHLEAQSFWQEHYIDLWDFCFCLSSRCEAAINDAGETATWLKTKVVLNNIKTACDAVTQFLTPGLKGQAIVKTGFAGSALQYSHGLCIFFPWSEPTDSHFWKRAYKRYKFSSESSGTLWPRFLQAYFDATMRRPVVDELKAAKLPLPRMGHTSQIILERIGGGILGSGPGSLGQGGPRDTVGGGGPRDTAGQGGPRDGAGADCGCEPLKNYPPVTRGPWPRKARKKH
jgi:hypothetical protein